MSRLYLRSPAPPFHSADGTALASSVTLTDISPAPNIVPAAFTLLEVGMEIEINAYGEFSTTATPTLLLGLYWGGVAGTTPLAVSGAITTATTGAAWPWQLYYRGRIRSVGTTGSIKGVGKLDLGTALTTMATSWIPTTQALRTVTIDTTGAGAKALTVGAQWGTSNAANTVTCYDISVDIAN